VSEDIVARLLAWSDGAREQGVQDVADGLSSAAEEIERLRAERDEARRWVCDITSNPALITGLACADSPRAVAQEQGWNCYDDAPDTDSQRKQEDQNNA
jgi:hypothetical protein